MPLPRLADYPCRSGTGTPLLSIVTTVRNGAKTLARAIQSVRAQGIPGLEYIIVDAVSTDGTLDIIRANSDIVTYWQSEPDRGISDGFNKGIALSRGEYVMLLNADDWLSQGQLALGLEALKTSGADFVFGDLIYHDAAGAELYRVQGDAAYAKSISHVMPALNHPTLIVRRTAYERHGLFDLDLRFAMDYEFLLRIHGAGCKGVYEPRMAGHMTLQGASDRNAIRALREGRDIAVRHGFSPFLAELEFHYRRLKSLTRRQVENILPGRPALILRHLFNKSIVEKK